MASARAGWRNEFVHTLVPIAARLRGARTTSRCCSSRARRIAYLASDPLGDGSNIFGTADRQIDYTLIGANGTWYWQVAFVVSATWPP